MTRVSTTVLATEMDMPKTRPAVRLPPSRQKTAAPASVAAAIWMSAPLTAICRTASRSLRWKCRPTPNMSRMMPISAH